MRFQLTLGVCFLVLATLPARAQAPSTIGHQGVLTTSGGAPVADGAYSLTFRLYSASTGGTALWTETHSSASVSSGVFSVVLGSVAPLNISFEQPLWLSVSVNSGAELSPRVQLTAAPYSMTAKSVADNAVTSSEIADGTIATTDLADNAVATAKIADNAVTGAKVASGQVVKTLNSLTDAVTLAAGSNVTITPSGNTLTIAASVSGGNTLDQAYDQGGAGAGRAITADAGALDIQGTGGLTVAGNVGIGTTSPGNKLHVDLTGSSEEVRIDKDVNWAGSGFTQLRLSDRTTPNKMLRIGYSGTGDFSLLQSQESGVGVKPLVLNPNGGNVGIGTTSPPEKLSIEAGHINLNHSTAPYMRFQRAAAEHGYVGSAGALFVGTETDFGVRAENNLVFGVSSVERMHITSTGNVGIGTTSPARKLDVSGDVNFTGTIYNSFVNISGTADAPGGYTGISAQGTNRALYLLAGGSGTVWIDPNTNVGIGIASAPAEKLIVAGNVAPSTDNASTCGTAALRWSTVYAANGTINTSDARLKTGIRNLPYGLRDVMRLRPVAFRWKDRPGQAEKIGLIAQEVQPVIPEVVNVGDDEKQTLGLYYADLVPVLIKAVQEQQALIETQRREIDGQRAALKGLMERVEALENQSLVSVRE